LFVEPDCIAESLRTHLDAARRDEWPDILYHYTDQFGLIGIVNTSELWATKIHYMNDSTEFSLALGMAKDFLKEKLVKVEQTESTSKKSERDRTITKNSSAN
jgi:hypothetical protein